ncbi:SAM-dependent methyltransferase [Micromonospora sp. NPDC047620]|uniref:SAM-dependent methyltransferase n=1 Tax=Micromonospora sp. NPDC047620 TaxID=3364251 RepID=UPI00370FCE1E
MTTESSVQSDGIGPSVPTAAGMYDYYLGGRNNFAADRRAANKVIAAAPEVILMARENITFGSRLVSTCASSSSYAPCT